MKSFLTKLQSYKNLFKLSLKGIKKSASQWRHFLGDMMEKLISQQVS